MKNTKKIIEKRVRKNIVGNKKRIRWNEKCKIMQKGLHDSYRKQADKIKKKIVMPVKNITLVKTKNTLRRHTNYRVTPKAFFKSKIEQVSF